MSVISKFKKLFIHVPRSNFKLPMKEYVALESYVADGVTYEIFKHKESRVQIVVNVDTLEVVGMKIGRISY